MTKSILPYNLCKHGKVKPEKLPRHCHECMVEDYKQSLVEWLEGHRALNYTEHSNLGGSAHNEGFNEAVDLIINHIKHE